MKLICYFVTMIRLDIAKTFNKLIEFLINLKLEHLHEVEHCIKYLHDTKFLKILYIAFEEKNLTIITEKDDDINIRKHVFEAFDDVFFVNENDRKSIEDYAFKLFEKLID